MDKLHLERPDEKFDYRNEKCVCCFCGHKKKNWSRFYLLSPKGIEVASRLLGKNIQPGYCCCKMFTRVKRYYGKECLSRKEELQKRESRSNDTGNISVVPFSTLFERNTNQTISLAHDDLSVKSVLVVKKKYTESKMISKKHKMKLMDSKCLPLKSQPLTTTEKGAVELLAIKETQNYEYSNN